MTKVTALRLRGEGSEGRKCSVGLGVQGRRVKTEWKEETRMRGKLERRTMEAAETVPGKREHVSR